MTGECFYLGYSMTQTRKSDYMPLSHSPDDESIERIVKVNRSVPVWQVVGSAVAFAAMGSYQAAILWKSNDDLQKRIGEQTAEMSTLTKSIQTLVRENDRLGYRAETQDNRLTSLTVRVDVLESKIATMDRERKSGR